VVCQVLIFLPPAVCPDMPPHSPSDTLWQLKWDERVRLAAASSHAAPSSCSSGSGRSSRRQSSCASAGTAGLLEYESDYEQCQEQELRGRCVSVSDAFPELNEAGAGGTKRSAPEPGSRALVFERVLRRRGFNKAARTQHLSDRHAAAAACFAAHRVRVRRVEK
jgi:hypothetical protein